MDNVGAYVITTDGINRQLPDVVDRLATIAGTVVVGVEDGHKETRKWSERSERVDRTVTTDCEWPVDEPQVRKNVFDACVDEADDPEWILCLDDDELLLRPKHVGFAISQSSAEYLHLTAYPMWKENYYRSDGPWNPSIRAKRFGFRVGKGIDASWPSMGPHSGRFPKPNEDVKRENIGNIVHMGWYSNDEEKRRDYLHRKLDNDRWRWEYPSVTNIGERQMEFYRTFTRKPELQELPQSWIGDVRNHIETGG